MLDLRFFKGFKSATIGEILENVPMFNVDPAYLGVEIRGVATLSSAGLNDIAFLSNAKYKSDLQATKAGAVLVQEAHAEFVPKGTAPLICPHVLIAYARILDYLYPSENFESKIGNLVKISNLAKLPEECVVGDFVTIGDNVRIGQRVKIGSNVVIGDGVVVGDGSRIGDNVTISHAVLGKNVVINSGARIGESGFGMIPLSNEVCYIKQLGRVIIGDNVRIGANTTIDRGSLEDTEIGANTIIDNLVQIGHNVKIGSCSIIVSQVGIAGSTRVGDHSVLAGQVGVAGHLVIGNNVTIAAKSGVAGNIPDGSVYAGIPAKDARLWRRESALLKSIAANREQKLKKATAGGE